MSLECPICRSPLVDPVMPRLCQHLFCSSCLHRALDLSSTCPIDRTRIRNRDEDLVEAPRVVFELLGELIVKCSSCRQELKREEWERHEGKCAKRAQSERGQDKTEPDESDEVAENLTFDVDEPRETCRLCQRQLVASELLSHTEECAQVPRPCQYCSEILPSVQHATHMLVSCPLVPTPCPHASFGCSHLGPRQSLLTDHLYSECPYEPLKDCFERIKEREREWEAENWQLKRKVVGLEERLEDAENSLRDTRYSLGTYFTRTPACEDRPSPETLPLPPLVCALSNNSSRNTALSSSLNTLTQSQTDSLHTTQHLLEEINSMRSVIGGMRMQMGDLMRTVQILSTTAGSSREFCSGVGPAGEVTGRRWVPSRPALGSRRSDSSDEQEQDPYQDVDRYFSSSASDPEEDLLMFSTPPMHFPNRAEMFSRVPPIPSMKPHSLPTDKPTWTPRFDYGLAGGPVGAPSLYNFGFGAVPSRGPFLASSYSDRRNNRVVGGIGGGMKL